MLNGHAPGEIRSEEIIKVEQDIDCNNQDPVIVKNKICNENEVAVLNEVDAAATHSTEL